MPKSVQCEEDFSKLDLLKQRKKKRITDVKCVEEKRERKATFIKFENFSFSEGNCIGSGERGTQVYRGQKKDGTEVAVKRIDRTLFQNNLKLQDLNIGSENVLKYMDLQEDKDFYYLAVEQCECNLDGYIGKDSTTVEMCLKKVMWEILHGLQALHAAGVIHSALKPSSIFIDSRNTAKLADYGSIYKLKRSRTAETQSWEATEILNEPRKRHTKKSDIQVAGMLVYYILSGREHPFGDREENIKNGTYSLEHVKDVVAKDLIEWMINREPKNRPTIDDVLQHPYFWDNNRKDLVLRRLGDREEVQKYKYPDERAGVQRNSNYYDQLHPVVAEFTTDNIRGWKLKMASWGSENSILPGDLLGLLRFLRNKLVHDSGNFAHNFHDNLVMRNVREFFPEFFICLHRLGYELEWEY